MWLLVSSVAPHYCEGVLVSKTEVNHNTLIFRVRLPHGTIRHVPVGTHVYLKALVEGQQPGTCPVHGHVDQLVRDH